MKDFKTLPDISGRLDGGLFDAARTKELLEHFSMKIYYTVEITGDGGYSLSELPTTAVRAEMLRPIFDRLAGEYGKDCTVLDLACSPGYFMFKLAEMGFENVSGVDARAEHRDQFALLNSHYGFGGLKFHHSDMYEFLDRQIASGVKYDICMLYGFLYHTSTPVELLRKIRQVCGSCLVIDTTLNFRDDFSLSIYEEPMESPRSSTSEISFNPSLKAVPKLIAAAGYARSERFLPLPEIMAHHPGGEHLDYYFDLDKGRRARPLLVRAINRLTGKKIRIPSRRAVFIAYP